jgi:uncharacterized membrane protein YfcA
MILGCLHSAFLLSFILSQLLVGFVLFVCFVLFSVFLGEVGNTRDGAQDSDWISKHPTT